METITLSRGDVEFSFKAHVINKIPYVSIRPILDYFCDADSMSQKRTEREKERIAMYKAIPKQYFGQGRNSRQVYIPYDKVIALIEMYVTESKKYLVHTFAYLFHNEFSKYANTNIIVEEKTSVANKDVSYSANIKAILERSNSGEAMSEIAKDIGISLSSLYNWRAKAKKEGYTVISQTPASNQKRKKAQIPEIAKETSNSTYALLMQQKAYYKMELKRINAAIEVISNLEN